MSNPLTVTTSRLSTLEGLPLEAFRLEDEWDTETTPTLHQAACRAYNTTPGPVVIEPDRSDVLRLCTCMKVNPRSGPRPAPIPPPWAAVISAAGHVDQLGTTIRSLESRATEWTPDFPSDRPLEDATLLCHAAQDVRNLRISGFTGSTRATVGVMDHLVAAADNGNAAMLQAAEQVGARLDDLTARFAALAQLWPTQRLWDTFVPDHASTGEPTLVVFSRFDLAHHVKSDSSSEEVVVRTATLALAPHVAVLDHAWDADGDLIAMISPGPFPGTGWMIDWQAPMTRDYDRDTIVMAMRLVCEADTLPSALAQITSGALEAAHTAMTAVAL